MLDRKTRLLQKRVKAAGEEIMSIQNDIGALLAKPIPPGDTGVLFRCKLLLNRSAAVEKELDTVYGLIDDNAKTMVTRTLIVQNKQFVDMQKNTLNSLLNCLKRNNSALLEAKRAALYVETKEIAERVKKNAQRNRAQK